MHAVITIVQRPALPILLHNQLGLVSSIQDAVPQNARISSLRIHPEDEFSRILVFLDLNTVKLV